MHRIVRWECEDREVDPTLIAAVGEDGQRRVRNDEASFGLSAAISRRARVPRMPLSRSPAARRVHDHDLYRHYKKSDWRGRVSLRDGQTRNSVAILSGEQGTP